MSNNSASNSDKAIKTTDVLSSAAITSIATFVLLTWSKTLPPDSAIASYVNEQTISFVAGLISLSVTLALSFVRYEVKLKLYERDYTKKIKCLNDMIAATSCTQTKEDLERQKNDLLKSAAQAVVQERL
ncbi:hypothetical protein P3394_19365 [Vibrio parahaemolyticus]|nr:hypothetical protein [Vibrio parahaemolyticus]ELB2121777.1 hypothetical protein [Vibrio parahaemolyticus]MDF4503782.1 hypothetical protein [Vibrio parahaemolyticus]MDG3428593.1 hypothetical protein [Vibrio parahaemolyticus]